MLYELSLVNEALIHQPSSINLRKPLRKPLAISQHSCVVAVSMFFDIAVR